VVRAYVYFATLPTTDGLVLGVGLTGLYFKASDSKLYVGESTTLLGASGVAITTGVQYRLELKRTATTLDAQVDGTAVGQYSGSFAAETSAIAGVPLGIHTRDQFTDDILISQTAADYPLGAGYVLSYIPNADGTHNVAGANDFERTLTGTDITNATTTAYQLIDERPLPTTAVDFINGIAPPNSTDYVEWTYEDSVESGDPRTVEAIFVHHDASGAGTNNFTVTLREHAGSTSANIFSGTTNVGATITYKRAHFATVPGTSDAWTTTKFNALRSRFLVSDASPDPYIDAIMLEAEFAVGGPVGTGLAGLVGAPTDAGQKQAAGRDLAGIGAVPLASGTSARSGAVLSATSVGPTDQARKQGTGAGLATTVTAPLAQSRKQGSGSTLSGTAAGPIASGSRAGSGSSIAGAVAGPTTTATRSVVGVGLGGIALAPLAASQKQAVGSALAGITSGPTTTKPAVAETGYALAGLVSEPSDIGSKRAVGVATAGLVTTPLSTGVSIRLVQTVAGLTFEPTAVGLATRSTNALAGTTTEPAASGARTAIGSALGGLVVGPLAPASKILSGASLAGLAAEPSSIGAKRGVGSALTETAGGPTTLGVRAASGLSVTGTVASPTAAGSRTASGSSLAGLVTAPTAAQLPSAVSLAGLVANPTTVGAKAATGSSTGGASAAPTLATSKQGSGQGLAGLTSEPTTSQPIESAVGSSQAGLAAEPTDAGVKHSIGFAAGGWVTIPASVIQKQARAAALAGGSMEPSVTGARTGSGSVVGLLVETALVAGIGGRTGSVATAITGTITTSGGVVIPPPLLGPAVAMRIVMPRPITIVIESRDMMIVEGGPDMKVSVP
jgi:hypothetical protein